MLPLELHIYGPAFSLPSVDTHCLAAVALLKISLQNDQWSLHPTNDPSISPFNELPALKHGDLWIAGFCNISDYLESQRHDLRIEHAFTFRTGLDEKTQADTVAYLAFLSSRGLPLLDLSLYVSTDNYTTITRSALSDLLPWPQSWIIPQRLRAAARKRSEHLGLSGLDVDAVREKELRDEKSQESFVGARVPEVLRRKKKSVSGLLESQAETVRFRLEAVTEDFFEPLGELLGKDGANNFLGEQWTVLSCFALAVLCHMDVEGLPQPWLRHALEKKTSLHTWMERNAERVFGNLPWVSVEEKSWGSFTRDMLDKIADVLPVTLVRSRIRTMAHDEQALDDKMQIASFAKKQMFYYDQTRYQRIVREAVAGCVSSAGLVGTLLYLGILSFPSRRRPPPMVKSFGYTSAFQGL